MDYLGINSLDDLPKLNEILQFEVVVPTNAEEAVPSQEENEKQLVVSEQGELIEVENMNNQNVTNA